jgi:hypothetical protein
MAAASVAERHGAAYRYVAYAPEMLPSSEHAPIVLPHPHLPRWANRLAWWLLLRSYNAVLSGKLARERDSRGLVPCATCRNSDGSSAARRRSRAGSRPEDLRARITVIGCLHPFDGPAPANRSLPRGGPRSSTWAGA